MVYSGETKGFPLVVKSFRLYRCRLESSTKLSLKHLHQEQDALHDCRVHLVKRLGRDLGLHSDADFETKRRSSQSKG